MYALMNFDGPEDRMVSMLEVIFREHDWSLEQMAGHHRKPECIEAVKTVLGER